MNRVVLWPALVLALLLLNGGSHQIALAAPPAQEGGQEYTIQADDWLSKLAEKFYGDVTAWPAIWEATNAKAGEDASFAKIDDPNIIEVGQKLWIPASEEAAATLAQVGAQSPGAKGEVLASPGTLQKILQQGYFTFGLEAQYRPFEFRDENENIVGYDIDIANEIGKRLGVEARPVDTSWPTVIQTLYDGGFDFILGGMTGTEARYERVNFSVPYMDASSGLLVRSGEGITDRQGLNGKIVGAGEGTPSVQQLEITAEELGIQYAEDIKTYDDDAAAYEAMKAKRVDAYASSVVSLVEFAKANPGFEVIPFKSEKWAAEWSVAAFRKEDEPLRAVFNDILVQMKADGALDQLQQKWFEQTFSTTNVPPTWPIGLEPEVKASPGTLEKILREKKFTFGLEAQYRPFEFRDENENIIGYDIDIANEIGARLGGVQAQAVDTSWPTVIQTLYDGGFDFILGGMTATEERYKRVNFSVPYMDAASGLIVRAGEGIAERKDLNGKIVGAGEGTPSVQQLEITAEELGIQYAEDIKTYDDDAAAYEAMKAKRVDAYASSVVSLVEFAKANPGYEVIPFKSSRWAAEYSAAAFRKEDIPLRAVFNDILVQMKADGTLAKLQEKWFGQVFETPNVPPAW
ncbi:MAG: transporter substrate-binding domain-containing protein [Anaerolineae bacterium]